MTQKNLMAAIIILEGDTSNGNLVLKDGNERDVSRNEVVTWIIHPGSGVASITAIPIKEGFPDVFSTGPSKLGNSENWQGRIRNEFMDETEKQIVVDYDIEWKDIAGEEYIFDPKLMVNI